MYINVVIKLIDQSDLYGLDQIGVLLTRRLI